MVALLHVAVWLVTAAFHEDSLSRTFIVYPESVNAGREEHKLVAVRMILDEEELSTQ